MTQPRPDPSPSSGPRVTIMDVAVDHGLPVDTAERVLRQHLGHFRLCYEERLRASPGAYGFVTMAMPVDARGAPQRAGATTSTTLPTHKKMIDCMLDGATTLSFPTPDRGAARVSFMIKLEPATFDVPIL